MEENHLHIPMGWEETNINKIILSLNQKGKQIKTSEYLESGTFPVIDQSEKHSCGFSNESKKVISENLPVTIFGDHTRHTKFIDFPFICGADGTQILKPRGNIHDKFFYYLISNASNLIGNHGYDRHFKHLREFKTTLPKERIEQQGVANVLSKLDQAIFYCEKLLTKNYLIKNGLMQELLTKGVDECGNIRTEQTHKFWDSPIGRIPKSWDVISLEELVPYNAPIVYGILMPGKHYDGGVPVIKVKDIYHEQIRMDDLLLTSPTIDNLYNRSRLNENDLLFTIRGTVGRCAFVPKELNGANITQDTARIRISNDLRRYVRYAFETSRSRNYIQLNTIGQAVKGINLGALRKLQIAKPSPQEAKYISDRLDQVDQLLKEERKILFKLKSIKTGLMQDLLTGKVRIKQ